MSATIGEPDTDKQQRDQRVLCDHFSQCPDVACPWGESQVGSVVSCETCDGIGHVLANEDDQCGDNALRCRHCDPSPKQIAFDRGMGRKRSEDTREWERE